MGKKSCRNNATKKGNAMVELTFLKIIQKEVTKAISWCKPMKEK